MTAAEAHELALAHIQLAHELGSAVSSQSEFLISVSYALLVLAFVAPQVLNRVTTPLVVALYLTYVVAVGSNMIFDLETAHASMLDAEALLDAHEIELATFEEKIKAQRDRDVTMTQEIGRMHMPALVFATVGYVCFVSYRNWKSAAQDSEQV